MIELPSPSPHIQVFIDGSIAWMVLERAATMANHSSTRTTQFYDRRSDDVSRDEVERILI